LGTNLTFQVSVFQKLMDSTPNRRGGFSLVAWVVFGREISTQDSFSIFRGG
jgi:hypothetical protein